MQGLVIFIIFIIFSVIRTVAESQKKQQSQEMRPVRRVERPASETFQEPPGVDTGKQLSTYLTELYDIPVQEMTGTQKTGHVENRPARSVPTISEQESIVPGRKGFLSDKNELVRGIVFAEILGPPRAFRHGRQR